MSQALERNSESLKSSQKETEHHSDDSNSRSKLEEGSTTLEEDMFLSIQYPSPPNFPTPYLYNQDFRHPDKVLKYITKHFNLKTIHRSLKSFPDLSLDFIYSNTFVDPTCDSLLQCYINKSICDQNALLQDSQNFKPDILYLMKLILLSFNISYSQPHLFFPCSEQLFKKAKCPKIGPHSIKQWRWGTWHPLPLHPPQYYGQPQDSPSNTKWFHHIWSTGSKWRRHCWLEENKEEECESKTYEEDQKKSRIVGKVEKRVEANTQVE